MNNIDNFFTENIDKSGVGACSYNENAININTGYGDGCSDDIGGLGYNDNCSLGKGRGASNGIWDSKGYGSGMCFNGDANNVVGYCYVKVNNLYERHR